MIAVAPAAEPANFDTLVRQPGISWLQDCGLAGLEAFPPKTKIKPLWTKALPDLLDAYDRICAYASLRIHPITGAQSADHFAPKSRCPAQTYEWSNYRLACSKMNARKNNFTDVLDPFTMAPNTFELNLANGALAPSASLTGQALADAKATVERLKLDDVEMRIARRTLITDYLNAIFTTDFLRSESPFIWSELQRQGLLRP